MQKINKIFRIILLFLCDLYKWSLLALNPEFTDLKISWIMGGNNELRGVKDKDFLPL